MNREPLPNRRHADTFDFQHAGLRFTASIGRYPDGRIGEVFLNCSKLGTAADSSARDAAIAISIAIQYGVPLATLRHAMTRNSDATASSPIGRLLDILAK